MNRLHLYMGNGKGKTTAAMGLAVRSLGHGNRVLVGQFIKDGSSGELAALSAIPGAMVRPAPPMDGFFFEQTPAQQQETIRSQTAYIRRLMEAIADSRPDTIVLDELGVALELGVVEKADAESLIAAALSSGETVVTGAAAPAWLIARADYISRIEAVRHPYDTEGLQARKGVEW